ncbi:hypothetical protein GLOTRDRAFT_77157 [Gloeophyllum trabeum ATCC 11539]|uniref:RING-type domain-containing protein n=1 Tax=Gloeophyllum trabeum (strain ATCC 11539 / FP-39264 / Madison 617) TaxID=670483 RepID=S7RP41_GLOTA|nr:uncharacterized protein GLOTRDRAFT_77157 [Gloeophyllum trabeum ATCC 11539]EPQ54559.1 hypothetical protein GLOTRDRAFT_77157 [Gloeophyllum trabeum ATCC 11539]
MAHQVSAGSTSSGLEQSLVCATVKRRASPSFEDCEEGSSRKRLKEDKHRGVDECNERCVRMDAEQIIDEMEQELQCGCCSGLVYRPVIVSPCQHFFCGSCCMLWIRNGGTNCPVCRGISGSVTPSRAIQRMVDLLLKAAPHKARPERERQQADEVYTAGSMRIPLPREPSPEPTIHQNTDLARPCPHCDPANPWGWRCPQPIPDPVADLDHAWHLDDGAPPGHAYCGNCENLMALNAPTSTKCDLCQVSFCGIGVQGRCVAAPLLSQHPHGMSEIGDLIMSSEVYECFDSNTVEVDIMIDYLTAHRLTPRHIYREIVGHLQGQPRGFAPLIELELFSDVHGVVAGTDPDPTAPRSRICRLCATEVLLWGLRDWWIRERQKGLLDESIVKRMDCPDGSGCQKQKDLAHAREFNHVMASPGIVQDLQSGGQRDVQVSIQSSTYSADPSSCLSAVNRGFTTSHTDDEARVAREAVANNVAQSDSNTAWSADVIISQ